MFDLLKIAATILVVIGTLLIAWSSLLTLRYRRKVGRTERRAANATRRPWSRIAMAALFGSYILVLPPALSRNLTLASKLLPLPLLTFAVTQYIDLKHFQKQLVQGVCSKETCELWIVPGYFGIAGCIVGCCGAFVYVIATLLY